MIIHFNEWVRRDAWRHLLDFVLIAALAISMAYWTWVVLTPPSVATPAFQSQPQAVALPAKKRNLFGSSTGENGVAAPKIASVRLLGVIAPRMPRTGRAIVILDGAKPTTLTVGDAIPSGWVLSEVHADHIVLSRDGLTERINLERRGTPPKG